MKTVKLLVLILICCHSFLKAQYGPLLLDKPGIFKVVNGSVYGISDNKFTKTETDANYKKLCSVAEVIHKSPAMSNLKGFDCDATLIGSTLEKINGYGIPCFLEFMFRVWFNQDGKEVRWNVEAPHWDMNINRLRPLNDGKIFDFRTHYASVKTNPNYTPEKWEKAAENLREIFQVPKMKENLGNGIDRYNGETVVIYNPEREPYWIPVTVGEAFDLLLGFLKLDPNQAGVDFTAKMVEFEYASFSESERNMNAYVSSQSRPMSKIGNDPNGDPIMRANPAYWNKSLPRSAIQILSLSYPADRDFLRKEKERQLKDNNGEYHISRFVEALDINTLVQLIDR